MRRTKAFILIFVPVFSLMAWTAYHASLVYFGDKVTLKVAGYDPRDLLSGHYLTYRVDYGALPLCEKRSGHQTCLCLSTPGNGLPATAHWAGECSERPECSLWLRGKCTWAGFEANIERYYFAERFSKQLATVPPDATIAVSLNGRGSGVVTGFFVKGEALMDYISRQ